MKINQYIDLTLLKTQSNVQDIKTLIDNAVKKEFFSVCINPFFVPFAKQYIQNRYHDSSLKIATVIGFPLGATRTENKVHEAKLAIAQGADEIDMVANISAFKSGLYDYVLSDINAVCALGKTVKVIIETSVLTDDEIVAMCKIFNKSNALFIKTSTGFVGDGAKIEHIKLIKQNIDANKKIKASGGIRDIQTAQAMIQAGADRIGTSSAHLWQE